MGLDMYLMAKYKKLVREDQKILKKNKIKNAGKVLTQIRGDEKKEDLYSWRKVNMIHVWFVKNVQDGEDNCQEYVVSRGKLEELCGILKEILDDPDKGEELLPTHDGFFFGSTDYGDWYLQEIKSTYKALREILDNKKYQNATFLYQSSW